jgi:UDP-N-acetylglucosamine 3-dehydrogenase
MSKLRVAIVGCGAVARHAHCPAWIESPWAEIVACCDPDENSIRRLFPHTRSQVAPYPSLDALLEHEKIDIVDICTPGFLHSEQALKAIDAGCHVLVEKPPVMNTAELRMIVDAAGRRGVNAGAMFNYRHRDLVMQISNAAAAGHIGTITRINITHHGSFVFGDAPWLWDEGRSRYLLWEFGIHFIDLLVHLLGPAESIMHVHAFAHESVGHTTDMDISVRFRSGAIGHLEIAADTTRHSSSLTRIDVYGSAQDCFVRWFPPLFRLRSGVDTPMAIMADEIRAAWSVASKLLRGEYIRHRNISHYRCIGAYVDWIRNGGTSPLSFESIEPTISLLELITAEVPGYNVGDRRAREMPGPKPTYV